MTPAPQFFRALTDRTRLRIVNLLARDSLCVCDMQRILRQPQSSVSRHLARLKAAGLIRDRRDGMRTFYALTDWDSGLARAVLGAIRAHLGSDRDYREDLETLAHLKAFGECHQDPAELTRRRGARCADPTGDLVVPAEVPARAGVAADPDIFAEAGAGGVRLVADVLRKVYVELTNRCNVDCAMCIRHGWQEPLGAMPLERYRRFLDGLPGPGSDRLTLAFSGFGEPLVHPSWLDMMREARARQHRVELITNGQLVDAEAARALVDLGVEQVAVSVDGGDGAVHARTGGVGTEGATAAVRRLLDARLRARRPLAIGVAAVATRTNAAGLPALLDWATDLRLDFVSISNLVPHTEAMSAETLWQRAGWASAFRPASWRPRLMVGRFDVDEATRPLATAVWGSGLTYPSPSVDEGGWRNRCRFAHEGMCAVSWDGRVSPCLSLLHGHTEYINAQARRVNEHVVGQIDEQPLTAIWRDAAFRAFRQRVRAFDFPPCFHCGGCPLTETNGEDCYENPAPVCGECLWAQGIVLCP